MADRSRSQQGDVRLTQTPDGGDITAENGIVEMNGGLETAVYLSLFGANMADPEKKELGWWGNIDEPETVRRYRSETQYLLNGLPAISSNLQLLSKAAKRDLQWLIAEKVANQINVFVALEAPKRVYFRIDIIAIGELSSFEFTENWEQPEISLTGDVSVSIPPEPPEPDYLLILDANNASRHKVTAFGAAQLDGNGSCSFDGASGTGLELQSTENAHSPSSSGWAAHCYFTPTNLDGSTEMILSRYRTDTNKRCWYIAIDGATAVVKAYMTNDGIGGGGNEITLTGSTTIANGVEHHVALVQSGSDFYLWLDGSLEATTNSAFTVLNSGTAVRVGCYATPTLSLNFTGTIRRVVVEGTDNGWTTPFAPPDGTIVPDQYAVLALDFAGANGSTRITDSAKPSYVIEASDDFTTLNRRKFDEVQAFNGASAIVSNELNLSFSENSSYNIIQENLRDRIPGDFVAIVNYNDLDADYYNGGGLASSSSYWILFIEAYIDGTAYRALVNQRDFLSGAWNGRGYYNGSSYIQFDGTVPLSGALTIERSGTTLTFKDGTTTLGSLTVPTTEATVKFSFQGRQRTVDGSASVDIDSLSVERDNTPIQIETDPGAVVGLMVDTSGNERDFSPTDVKYDPFQPAYIFDGLSSIAYLQESYLFGNDWDLLFVASAPAQERRTIFGEGLDGSPENESKWLVRAGATGDTSRMGLRTVNDNNSYGASWTLTETGAFDGSRKAYGYRSYGPSTARTEEGRFNKGGQLSNTDDIQSTYTFNHQTVGAAKASTGDWNHCVLELNELRAAYSLSDAQRDFVDDELIDKWEVVV